RWLLALAVPAVASQTIGCETVDLGEPPADGNDCRPSEQYFIDEVCQIYLSRDDYPTAVHCYDASCHGALAPNAMDLVVPTVPGAVPLIGDWAANYMAVTEEMSCVKAATRKRIELPAGLKVHGGGKLIEPDGPEATLVK